MRFHHSISLGIVLVVISVLAACSGSSKNNTTLPPTISITATAGTPQSASIGTAFGAQLQATVTSSGSPASGVSVTFSAPSSGASGTFATSPAAATDSETTNSSGVATSQVFTANTTSGAYTVTASVAGANSTTTFNLTNMTAAPAAVTASSGGGQSTIINTAFGNPLVAAVTDSGGNPIGGVSVTFTTPATGASGTFATNPASATDTEITSSSGLATSQTFTANATTGTYAVTASVAGVSSPATFNLANNALPAISVTIGPSPASLQVSGGTGLTAFVANDVANAGVTWTVTCGSANACGTYSATNVPSGVATDFSAPGAVPANNTVTVIATSVTDSTKRASRTIIVTNPNTTLADGTYIFSLGGENGINGNLYYGGGAFQVSGGAIIGGEQDYADSTPIYAEDAITGGSIAISADGNLTITLTTADPKVGVNGVETLDAALISPTRARLIEFDSLTSHGRVDLQSSTTAPAAGWAFMVAGLDGAASPAPVAIGGVFNIDGVGSISGNGSVFDINDGSLAAPLQDQMFGPSTISSPDGFGRVVFNLVPSTASGIATMNLVGYIVDSSHIRLLETSGDSFGGTMGGIAIAQGANTGTFSNVSVAGNSYVVGMSGFDTSASGVLDSAGVLAANSDGTVNGAFNYNDFATAQPSPVSVAGTYTVDATGRITMSNVTDGSASFTIQIYLTGQPGESEVVEATMDLNDIQSGLGWLQTGSGSFTGTSLFGSYTLNASGFDPANIAEFDTVGSLTADGSSSLTGTVDLNWLGNTNANITPTVGVPISGTFNANANGAFAGTITGLDVTSCPVFNTGGGGCTVNTFSYYLIDTTKIFAIETDTNQLTLGFLTLEQ